MELKSLKEIFTYLMNGYKYELKDVETKQGKNQKRLKDEELGNQLNIKIKKKLKFDGLFVELKLGPAYNRTVKPWIQIFSSENRKGTKGRYVGISFDVDEQEVSSWIGFGCSGKKQGEIISEAKEYIRKYKMIEEDLEYGYRYNQELKDAIIIKKAIVIKDMTDVEFLNDINYLTNLYKKYENQYEEATFEKIDENEKVGNENNLATREDIQRINKMMLQLTKDFSKLVEEIQKLNLK